MENYPQVAGILARRFDIETENVDFSTLTNEEVYNNLIWLLSAKIESLLRNNFSLLVQLMYQIDVAESDFEKALSSPNLNDAAKEIAVLVFNRQMQKWKYQSKLL